MAEKPEDLNLPASVITRMIKEVLPEGVNISKEARAAISKSASVFVLYATSCANNNALQNKRKTLTANDVFDALREMEFEQFVEPLQESLEVFKKEQKGKRDAAELKRKQKQEAAGAAEEKKTTDAGTAEERADAVQGEDTEMVHEEEVHEEEGEVVPVDR